MINIAKENIQIQVSDIPDVELTTAETKTGTKLQAHRRITTIPYKTLHQDFQKLYNSSTSCRSLNRFMFNSLQEKKQKCAYVPSTSIHIV